MDVVSVTFVVWMENQTSHRTISVYSIKNVIFENPHTGMHQLSSDLRNVYNHASVRCVTQEYSTFNPSTDVKVSGEVRAKLSGVHLAHLLTEFGLVFLNK